MTEPGAPEDIQFSENPKSSGLQTQHGHHCSYELQSPQPAMSMPLLQQLAILPSSSVHKATTDAFPVPQSQSVQDRSSSLASVTSRVATAPGTSQDPPLVHGPRAVPAVVADPKLGSVTPHIIQLGPIFQPMLNSLQANPFYVARPLAQQAPLALMPRNQDTSPSSQIAAQLQKMLKAAQAIGYSQALRQQAVQPGNLSRLSFSKHRIQAQAGEAAEIPHSAESQHGQHDSHRPQPESRQGHQSSDTHTGSTHQRRLVTMTGPPSSAAFQSTARHMVAFRCNLADIVDAHWGPSSQAASAATTEPPASFEAAGITHSTDSNVATTAEPNRALPQMPLASSGDMVGTVQPSRTLAASRLRDTASTSALPSLTPAPQVMARRAPPPPQRATAQSVAVAVAAAQGTDWALAAHAAAARSSMGGSFPNLALQNQQGATSQAPAQASTSLGAQHGGPFHSNYMLSSFPQVMQQLMLEPSMEFMHSWVASHQPPVPASGQLVTSAAHLGHGQEDARSAKRLCHGKHLQNKLSVGVLVLPLLHTGTVWTLVCVC